MLSLVVDVNELQKEGVALPVFQVPLAPAVPRILRLTAGRSGSQQAPPQTSGALTWSFTRGPRVASPHLSSGRKQVPRALPEMVLLCSAGKEDPVPEHGDPNGVRCARVCLLLCHNVLLQETRAAQPALGASRVPGLGGHGDGQRGSWAAKWV